MQINVNLVRRGLIFSALATMLPQAWGESTLTMAVWKGQAVDVVRIGSVLSKQQGSK